MVLPVGGEVGSVTTDELLETLELEFYSFDVLQLVAVIEELLEDADDGVDNINAGRGRIFFEVDASLAFPPSDVGRVGIDTDNDDPYANVRLPLMNLLGSASPLPVDFSDHITRGRANADMYADFLSILQNRLHTLWIDAQRVSVTLSRRRELAPNALWRLSNKTRSAQGLKELLYTVFGDIPINIEENIGRYAAVSNAQPLGGAARLGRNVFAGTGVFDRTAKFRLTLGPLDFRTYESFMPGGDNSLLINEILSVYLNEPVICEVSVTCEICDLPRARLGGGGEDGGNKIGRTAVLGTKENGRPQAARVPLSTAQAKNASCKPPRPRRS